MKLIKTTALLATFTAAFATAAFAESSGQRSTRGGKPGKPDSAALASRLTEDYAKIASYDLNLNGQLEESEQDQLVDAITAGTVTFAPPPGRTPPDGSTRPVPPAGHRVRHIAGLYSAVAPYDANVDGTLNTDEQAALKAAIEGGTLALPGGPGGKGPGRKGHEGRKGAPATPESCTPDGRWA